MPVPLPLILRWCAGLVLGAALMAGDRPAWTEVRSPHFVAYTDARAPEAQGALKEFEEIRAAFLAAFPAVQVDPRDPVVVFVHRDQASMKELLPEEFEGPNPKRPSGYFLGRGDRNYALLRLDARYQSDQPYHVVYHEFTHGILHRNFRNIPVWLDEGLAEFYGETRIQSDKVLIGSPSKGSLEILRGGGLLPLERLLQVTQRSPEYREGDKTGMFYAEAWALTHYLLMEEAPVKAGLFTRYLEAQSEEPDPVAAARRAWGNLEAFQAAFFAYLRQPRFRYWNLPLALQLPAASFPVRPLGEAEGLVVRAEFLRDRARLEASEARLREALALDPKLPAAHVALAMVCLDRGDRGGTRTALEAAESLGSQDPRTPLVLARLDLEDAAQSPGARARLAARLERAVALGPRDAEARFLRARFLASEPGRAAEAVAAGKQALELDPDNLVLWINFGYLCLGLDQEVEARAVAARLKSLDAPAALQARFGEALDRHAERVSARADAAPGARETPGGPAIPPSSKPPMRFSLPSTLMELGREVQALSLAGREGEAIAKVEAALAKTKVDVERRSLKDLLAKLRARAAKS
ncbi:MAG: DUF1570 domain-containing protein [Holophagaceae bacterium]